ncbi:MAG: PAS domain-containing protein, partial [Desulfobacteraceae bacterium]|nr:PAS domain-containing protein [Desulfobacteraceae bacterium]
LVDAVLPPEEMPKKLLEYFTYTKTILARKSTATTTADEQQQSLNKIFAILRTRIGHDFSAYKVNTILRRISRRMGLNQIDSHDTYVRFLRENPGEVETLFRELLIGVTSFFRDSESFDVLKTSVLPSVLEQMNEDDTFRAWIPGCSTGEEVYSLAIVLRELFDNSAKRFNLQLFGTDIDKSAIDKAREGLFQASITADVSKERLKRFFSKEDNFYRIRKEIRDCVVFSVQDLLKDPPFSRLNLLCCRNLLIYLNTEMQKKLLPLFHYTLKPDSILVLGSSETIGGFTHLFQTVDKKWKIFRRQEVPNALRMPVDFPSGLSTVDNSQGNDKIPQPVAKTDISLATQRAILDQFAPTAILIDAKGEILHIEGRTGKYLEALSGPPSQNILDLARDGLRIELSSAFRAAKTSDEQVTRKNIRVRTNGDVQMVDLHVWPQKSSKELAGKFLVVFNDIETKPKTDLSDQKSENPSDIETSRITELEKELQITRESHQTTVEELESSNEELKSTNEELQSSNEELQSTNEELESSKEELQSLNEELQTVNAELQSKVEELSGIQDDMKNLLNSTEIATIFVDNDLRVKRFTHEATKIVNFIQTDIGRPLRHVVTNLAYEGLMADLTDVLKNLVPKECEVQNSDGIWYKMRIMPYRTTDNRIDGCVITFSSIEAQKKSQTVLKESGHKFGKALKLVNTIFDMNPEPTVVLDDTFKAVLYNTAFSGLMDVSQEQVGELDILDSQSKIPKHTGLASKLKTTIKDGKPFETKSFALKTSKGEQRYTVHGRIIMEDDEFPYRILLRFVKKEE